MKELKCPLCGSDMKERVTSFTCRNFGSCKFKYLKIFPPQAASQHFIDMNTEKIATEIHEACQCGTSVSDIMQILSRTA